ncbi:MAG: OmpA/MotB family protein [Desulfomonilia bacterium]|uniref:Motility protein B n=1 Tax=anaerobic digester metagenome TaxID=1263854 RepID=A0A485M0A5_9ZZZZ|nr:OmpA family protein [Pseudomonadota bacterium]HON37781.1 OmpA family protein [Deltaproteobacteria bacterium]HRS55672.1 OmpA family protein [Desulfomonilia bacterium]HPD20853.1 OmpA family protein [Deltaproteobacteria bacterium]HPX19047.1 OmpA family protein [Deltaproteobacteria bacterium]
MANKDKNIEYINLPSRTQWLVTFSDMVTLLITFFVLIISMSSMDAKAMKDIFGFFNQAVGPLDFEQEQEVKGMPALIETIPPRVFYDTISLNRNILNNLESKGIGGLKGMGEDMFEVRQSSRGLAIMINGDILFNEGSHELKEDALPILESIAQSLHNVDSIISVEGHTDNRGGTPTQQYRLSMRRAGSVLDYFVYAAGMSPTKFALAGYGSSRPVESNGTEQGRKKNRRVEIILLRDRL